MEKTSPHFTLISMVSFVCVVGLAVDIYLTSWVQAHHPWFFNNAFQLINLTLFIVPVVCTGWLTPIFYLRVKYDNFRISQGGSSFSKSFTSEDYDRVGVMPPWIAYPLWICVSTTGILLVMGSFCGLIIWLSYLLGYNHF